MTGSKAVSDKKLAEIKQKIKDLGHSDTYEMWLKAPVNDDLKQTFH